MFHFNNSKTGDDYDFTQAYVKSLKQGKIVMRTCVKNLLDMGGDVEEIKNVTLQIMQEMKDKNKLPGEKFCLDVKGHVLGISGVLKVCGCSTDYCNDDVPVTAPAAEDTTLTPIVDSRLKSTTGCSVSPDTTVF